MDRIKTFAYWSAALWVLGAVLDRTGSISIGALLIDIFGTLTIILVITLIVRAFLRKRRQKA